MILSHEEVLFKSVNKMIIDKMTIDKMTIHLCLQDGKKNDREVANSDDAASANQKRMNADPLEVMLINMGYRLSASGFEADEEAEREGESPVTCRPS